MKKVRKTVLELSKYVVSQDRSVIKLNQNESPYDLPSELKSLVLKRLKKMKWNRYPFLDAEGLISAISQYTGFSEAEIVIGNGSNEILSAVFQTFCEMGDKVVFVSPGFSIYPRLARIMGLGICEVPLFKNYSFNVDAIVENSHRAKMIVVASPNNPTGTVLSINQIKTILKGINCPLVLDEAYFEFYGVTAQNLIYDFENLIIIRTFSKAFGLAGIRLGYLLAKREIAEAIRKIRLPFSVGMFQQIVGETVLSHSEFTKKYTEKIIKEREKLYDEMSRIPRIKPIRSKTNFIFFTLENILARDLFETLYKRKILIRYFDDKNLKYALRVTVGTSSQNNIFLEKLKKILNTKGQNL